MKNSNSWKLIGQGIISCAIPLCTATVALSTSALLSQTQISTHFTEFALLLFLAVTSTSICIWWLISTAVLIMLGIQVKRYRRAIAIPIWIPRILRNFVFAILGLGALASPSFAANSVPHITFSVTATENLAQSEVHPFFEASTKADEESNYSSEVQSITYTSTSTSPQMPGYTPLSPFFVSSEPPEEQPTTSRAESVVLVQRGDTLWSIAQREYASEDPVQIMSHIQQIVRANPTSLTSQDDIIFPGQQLHIPR